MEYFQPGGPGNGVHAVPGEGLVVPVYLLGSSDVYARLAAELGLPFAFASHFAPDFLHEALDIYRRFFNPSATLERPYVMVGVNAFAADSDAEGRRLFSSAQQQFLNMVRGTPGLLPPPMDSMDRLWLPQERALVEQRTALLGHWFPGNGAALLERFVGETDADELIVAGQIYDHPARL